MLIGSLTPAYGRDYKSKVEVEKDFNDNKDFVESISGQYINKQQLVELKQKSVQIRYSKLRKVAVIRL